GKLPQHVIASFGQDLQTDCQRALQYTRSAPYVRTALVGMKAPEHVAENLALTAVEPLHPDTFQVITHAGIKTGKFSAIRRILSSVLGK
ncbi:MAG: aldo/keto reductase, partial [Cyanobacteria bacterium J06639_14]